MKQTTLTLMKDLRTNSLLRGTIYITAGTFIGSFFSYLLQVVLGNKLTTADYGTFNALLSLSAILAIPTGAVTSSLIKVVAELKAASKFNDLTYLFVRLNVLLGVLALLTYVSIHIGSAFLGSYLNIENLAQVKMFGIYVALSLFQIAPVAYLQGLLRVKAFAVYSILNGFLRFSGALYFVYQSSHVGYLYIGMALGIFIMFFVAIAFLAKNFTKYNAVPLMDIYRRVLQVGIYSMFIILGMSLLNNIDVIMVKHYFSAETAGIFSAVVTIGKVFLFGAGTVTVIMYPKISELYAAGINPFPTFKFFFMLQLLVLGVGVVVFCMFARQIVGILFGEQFLPAVSYVPMFTIFVSLYVLINFLGMFYLAVNKVYVSLVLLPAVILQSLLITFFHNSISVIIYIDILIALMVTLYMLLSLVSVRKENTLIA